MLKLPTLVNDISHLPVRAHPLDAGADLVAAQDTILPFGVRVLVKTGVSVKIPAGSVGLLVPRSGLSKDYIVMTNSIGIIDSDYRGELLASLMFIGDPREHTKLEHVIKAGTRIVQLLVIPISLPVFEVFSGDNWTDTERGTGGFGSTGVK